MLQKLPPRLPCQHNIKKKKKKRLVPSNYYSICIIIAIKYQEV